MNIKIEIPRKFSRALFFLVATPLLASEPGVLEQTAPDGFTELRIVSDGTTIGEKRELKFSPVKARVFRLNVTEATDTPTIWELLLFAK